MSKTIQSARELGLAELALSPTPDIDVQVLLCHVLNCSSAYLMMHDERRLSEQTWAIYDGLLARRKRGEPIAYITGSRGFWSLDLAVNASTLIPRPDTELLVTLALSKLQTGMSVIDLGTGTGAIALSIAAEHPDLTVWATDRRFEAVQLARQNAIHNAVKSPFFCQMSWLAAFKPQSFDMVVSNPPYIRADDPHLNQGDVRFEPRSALVSGEDGLDDIRQIIKQSHHCLKPGGWLLLEHGYDQSEAVIALMHAAGFVSVTAHQDWGGQDRAAMGQLPL
jgi:release factor glutamine methyltransferase